MRKNDYSNIITKANKRTVEEIKATYYKHYYGDIYDAYDKPSYEKVRTYREIEKRAEATEGYNHDLRVMGRNTCTYTTLYSFTEDGKTYAVKDTHLNTYLVEVE